MVQYLSLHSSCGCCICWFYFSTFLNFLEPTFLLCLFNVLCPTLLHCYNLISWHSILNIFCIVFTLHIFMFFCSMLAIAFQSNLSIAFIVIFYTFPIFPTFLVQTSFMWRCSCKNILITLLIWQKCDFECHLKCFLYFPVFFDFPRFPTFCTFPTFPIFCTVPIWFSALSETMMINVQV